MKKNYIVTTLAVILLTSFTTYSKSTNGEIRGIVDTKNCNSGPVFIAPANDDPSAATVLTVGPDFDTNAVIGTNVDATASEVADSQIPAPPCGNYQGGDVWYTVVVPANGNIVFETKAAPASSIGDTAISVYSGTIGSLVHVICHNDSDGTSFSKINLSGQTPGETLFLRVWEKSNNDFGDFKVSAWSADAPANDEPSLAPALTVGPDFTTNAIVGSNEFATSTGDYTVSCGGTSDGDVWYQVIVPQNGVLSIETQLVAGSHFTDTVLSVSSGTIGSLVEIDCNDDWTGNGFSKIDLTGQTPGATLYIRVWEKGNNSFGNFQISAWSPPPANDDPSTATVLTVGPDFDTNAVIGTNVNATASEVADPQIPAPPCGNYQGGDVWYTVVIPANGNIVFETKAAPASSIGDTAISVYSGTIGSLVHLACHNDSDGISFSKINLSGQTPGETLFLRVWEKSNNDFGNFKVSAWSADAPANDEPSLAPALTVGPDFTTNAIVGSNEFATSTGDYTVSCGGTSDGDVWYQVIVPQNGVLSIETQLVAGSHFTDTVLSVSSGTIGSLVEIDCNDDWTGNGFSKIDLTGQTPGATLYIRVWEKGNNSFGNFQISAWNPPATPINDDPSGAIALTVGLDFTTNALVGTNALATASEATDTQIPAPGCASYSGGDVWYTVVVPANGILNIETQLESGSLLDDTGVGVYSGSIGALALIECDDLDGIDSFSLINLTGQTPGATLYIRAWENGNDATGDFQVSAWNSSTGPANDDPSTATALTVGPDFDTNDVIGTNVNATASEVADPQIPAPPCGNYEGGDVWYTVVVPANGNIVFETKAAPASSIGDTAISVYSGTIGSLVHLACHNDSDGISFSKINLSGQTPGETLFLRVWEKSNNDFGNFKVSAWSTDAPANDEPSLAPTLTVGPDFTTNAIVGSNEFATSTVDYTVSCGGTSDGDVWYQVIVPQNGVLSIETQLVVGSHFTDTVLSVSSGTIGSLVEIACNDDWTGNGFSKIDLTGQTPGTTLYIRLWEKGNNAFGNFQISAYSDASLTWVPDDNFETELIALGFDSGPLDDFVPTANINIVTVLDVSSKSIADLTGIEAFIALSSLNCSTNNLTDLDLSSNVALADLDCSTNSLISLDISNGNNSNMTQLSLNANPDLTCVQVDTQIIADDWNSTTNLPATFSTDSQTNFSTNCGEVVLQAKAYLQGALLNATGGMGQPIMNDDLRAGSLLPTTSPYGDNSIVNANVFNTGGASGTGFSEDDIVDWVRLELRDDVNLATVIAAQAALLQRDGDIVGLDGLSTVVFAQNAKHYNLVIKHRNHSAIITSVRLPFPKNQIIDFRSGTVTSLGSNSQVVVSGIYYAMWAGDVSGNGQVRYLGSGNDSNVIKDNVLNNVGNTTSSNLYPYIAYDNADINMNGQVRYLGSGNDTNILKDIILSHPANTTSSNLFPFSTQVSN